jgi:hypothetical protein
LIDSVATKAEILNAIGWLASNANANDTVTFTFSGRGVAPGEICPSDFTPVTGGLTTTQLADAFAAVKAKKILIILDCNYAAKFFVSLSKEGRVLMLSSSAQETSKESSDYQHGIFTYFILKALHNFTAYDANHDDELSAGEIASYANVMTTNTNKYQHPVLNDRVDGDLPLLAKLDFTLNIDLPAGTTVVTLDGVAYKSQPISQLWVPGSTHTMTVPDVVNVDRGTRYGFSGWGDGTPLAARTISKGSFTADYGLEYLLTVNSPYGETTGAGWFNDGSNASFSVTSSIETENTRGYFTGWSGDSTITSPTGSLTMDAPKTVTANWRTEYLLKLDSVYGNPTGAGWYNAGASVNISVEPSQGFLVQQIFDEWTGNSSGTEASTKIIMNSPKVIFANWHTDYFWLYIVVAIVIVIIVRATTAIILVYLKRKRQLT